MNDIDIWQNALNTINLNESVSFMSRGKLITESSLVEMYNKIQALLNTAELESCHKFLYALDPEELTEAEATKVNNLYKLGCDRGLIECDKNDDETSNESDANDTTEKTNECDCQTSNLIQNTIQSASVEPLVNIAPKTDAFTVLYSAVRDGQLKTGEAYSNAINPRSAKADVMSQLEKAGYTSISILAIECGDPDDAVSPNTYVKQKETISDIPDYAETPDYSEDLSSDEFIESKKINEDSADDANDAEKSDDESSEKDNTDSKDNEKTEKAEEPDEKIKNDTTTDNKQDVSLDLTQITTLKDLYKKAFKATMLKCKFENRSFESLTLDEKVQFFTVLNKAWNKEDPTLFMTDKEIDLLEKLIIKK